MFDWISSTMSSMGEIGVALLMLLENVFSADSIRAHHAARRIHLGAD